MEPADLNPKGRMIMDVKIQSNAQMITRLYFRLLPMQVLLAGIPAINAIVSSLFASNAISTAAISAVGLYAPFSMLASAICMMLQGGAQILCGKYMGSNQVDHTQGVFTMDLLLAGIISAFYIALHVLGVLCGWTGLLAASDPEVRRQLDQYVLGQAIGILPYMIGSQFSTFLSMENQIRRTTVASVIFIGANVVLNYLLVSVWKMESLGLALAASAGLWIFCLAQGTYYLSGKSSMKWNWKLRSGKTTRDIVHYGYSGALTNFWQTLRGILINMMLTAAVGVGVAGVSAYAAVNTFLNLFWAIPFGMMIVSRMLIGVALGEEDRQSLIDVMRNLFRRCVPLMSGIALLLILLAEPLARMYFQESMPEYQMTVMGFRLIPVCMPLSLIELHYVAYHQSVGSRLEVNLLGFLDGVACVAGFTALMIARLGLNSVYIANILNGTVCNLVIIAFAWLRRKAFPRNVAEWMNMPDDFGAPPEARLDLSVRAREDVVMVAQKVQAFCESRGIDQRRSHLAGLCMEEMAGNVVDHGFIKDKKENFVDIRVVDRTVEEDGALILRIKDDCIRFDPASRKDLVDPVDEMKNVGIRMVYSMAREIDYQNILGLNVLTIRV